MRAGDHPHQRIAARLFTALNAAAAPGGEVLFAGTRVKIAEEAFREPDLLYIPPEAKARTHRELTEGAALVMEVVSESNRSHDLRTKRRDYADAGIPEYWIVDPDFDTVIVLTLEGSEYAVHGEFRPGSRATSRLLPALSVDVTALFASA